MKLIPLTIATIKQFMRDKRSIALLIICPLILIGVVFVSFSPEGLRTIPAGFILEDTEFNLAEIEGPYFSYLEISRYDSLKPCLDALKQYDEYVCVHVEQPDGLAFTIYYDNTREPVIWEVLERLQQSFGLLQQQMAVEMATEFIDAFTGREQDIDRFATDLESTNEQIDDYIGDVETARAEVRSGREQLDLTLDQMDRDIAEAQRDLRDWEDEKNDQANRIYNAIDDAEDILDTVPTNGSSQVAFALSQVRSEINALRNEVQDYDSEAQQTIWSVEDKLRSYEAQSLQGRQYVDRLDDAANDLSSVRAELRSQSGDVDNQILELERIRDELRAINDVDPSLLVNPFDLQNVPTYTPEISDDFAQEFSQLEEEEQQEQIIKGLNLISLQTLFPTILLLITLFLSLLVSSFATLMHVNSSAFSRIRIIPALFIREVSAIYISSSLILILPLLIISIVGDFLFQLPVLAHLGTVFVILFLLVSSSVFTGMLISSLIRKESITLVVITFLFVFLTFFSGFILPVERMSAVAGTLAESFPAKIALSAFNKSVFYGAGFSGVSGELFALTSWAAALLAMLLIIEGIRRYQS